MKKITSKKFLEAVKNNRFAFSTDTEKRMLYEEYLKRFTDMLTFFPEDMALSGLSSLQGIFEGKRSMEDLMDYFDYYMRNTECKAIEIKFESILAELRTMKETVKKIRTINTVADSWLKDRIGKKHTVSLVFGVALFSVTLALIACSVLEIFDMLQTGGLISAVCGGVNLLLVMAFGIYEVSTNRQIKKFHSDKAEAEHAESEGRKEREASGVTITANFSGARIKATGSAKVGVFMDGANFINKYGLDNVGQKR